ncbi:MAG: DMT family transporter [Candidatus Omnitrophota bacterium]
MNSKKFAVYAGILLSMMFWGLSYPWIMIVYRCYHPITTVFLRLLVASVLMTVFSRLSKKIQRIERGDLRYFILLAIVQPFLYFLCESYGLKSVSPTPAAVIISTIPLFTPIAAFYFFKEKLMAVNIVGMAVAFGGVLLVVIKEDFTLSASPVGFILLSIAVAMGVTYTTLLKKISFKYNAITIVTYQNTFGIVGFLPLFFWVDWNHFLNAVPTRSVLISLGLLAVLSSSLAYVLYAYSVKQLGVSRASMFSNVMPVFTAVFAWMILDEKITLRMGLGILAVVGGLFISQTKTPLQKNKTK